MRCYYRIAAIDRSIGMGIIIAHGDRCCAPWQGIASASYITELRCQGRIDGDMCCYYRVAAIDRSIGMGIIIAHGDRCCAPWQGIASASYITELAGYMWIYNNNS